MISVVLVSEGPKIAAQPHVDAAGPVAVPPGSIAAGYGGAADPHGPLSELLLGGVAVAGGGGVGGPVPAREWSAGRAC